MKDYSGAWQDQSIPQTQWNVIGRERQLVSEGRYLEVAPYRVIIKALEIINPPEGSSIIEVGASSGFYKRVLEAAGQKVKYTALDYSQAFKDFSAKVLPDVEYILGDATALPLPDSSYDIVLSGCCLIHISDWRKAVAEASRVARKHVIFHRTPLHARPTEFRVSEAYGVDCLVNTFNYDEFVYEMKANRLNPVHTLEVFSDMNYGHYTIICEKL